MRILVTGASGFLGRHLCDLLRKKKGVEVYALSRSGRSMPGVRSLRGDLLSREQVHRAVRRARPDLVFHFAGATSVSASWKDPVGTFRANVEGTRCLLDALSDLKRSPRIIVSGSAEVYGRSPSGTRLGEERSLKPLNPYAVSKLAQEALCAHYGLMHDLPIIRVRSFNLTGPGQSETFVTSAFARQFARISKRLQPPEVQVGDLRVRRDFTDVRDAARAYWLLARRGEAGEVYNLCSGRPRPIREILRFYLRHASVRINIRSVPSRRRPTDIPELAGRGVKLFRATGWRPRISWERTLKDLYTDWLERI